MTGASNDIVDPGELLRRLRPHVGDAYLTSGADPRAEALLNRITSQEIDVRGCRIGTHAVSCCWWPGSPWWVPAPRPR